MKKIILILAISLLFFANIQSVKAQDDDIGVNRNIENLEQKDEIIKFTDDAFRQTLNRALKKDRDNQEFTKEELLNIVDLNRFPVRDAKSLEDLNNLPNLKRLFLMNVSASDFSPISNLVKLENLLITNFRENTSVLQISDLPKNIKILGISKQTISGIENFNDFPLLVDLSLDSNGENKYDNLDLPNLTSFVIRNNKLTSLDFITKFINLKKLAVDSNLIEDITPISELTKLEFLNISNNGIKDLSPLTAMQNLKELLLQNNQVSDFSAVKHIHTIKAAQQIIHLDAIKTEDELYIKNPFKWVDNSFITVPFLLDNIRFESETQMFFAKEKADFEQLLFRKFENKSGEKIMTGRIIIDSIKNPITEKDLNEPLAKNLKTFIGDKIQAKDFIENLSELPKNVIINFKEEINTSEIGDYQVNIIILYSDKSFDELSATLSVLENETIENIVDDNSSEKSEDNISTEDSSINNFSTTENSINSNVKDNNIKVSTENKNKLSQIPNTGDNGITILAILAVFSFVILLSLSYTKKK